MEIVNSRKYMRRNGERFYAHNNEECRDDPLDVLCAQIIMRAIDDWRLLVKNEAWEKPVQGFVNFAEIRYFFKSDWCDFIMQRFEIEPAFILEMLEAELAEAMKKARTKRKERK